MGTLVIGAGASMDVCNSFQSGNQLLDSIISLTTLSTEFSHRIKSDLNISENSIITFGNNLVAYKKFSENPSIDEFLSEVNTFPEYHNVRSDYVWIGKMAIMFCILKWENDFKNLIDSDSLDFKNTWIQKIMPYLITTAHPLPTGTLHIVNVYSGSY